MANVIRIKKRAASGQAGAPSSLAPSELAFNENSSDLSLYYGLGDDGSGSATSVIKIAGPGHYFSKTDTRTANTVLAGPSSGTAAAPTFRSLAVDDIPTITASKVSDFDTQVQTNRLDEMAAPTSSVAFGSQKITGLATCVADTDGANKAYVDGVAQGLAVKDSAKVATTANITLSGTQTIDGVNVAAGDRVLVKDQTSAADNGIWIVAAQAWARADDLDTAANAAGAFVFIESGTTQADRGFVCTSNTGSAVVGTNNLAFTQFSSTGEVSAGDGLDKTGLVFSVDLKANGGLVIESTEVAVDLSASSITGTLALADGGTGSTTASGARTNLGIPDLEIDGGTY